MTKKNTGSKTILIAGGSTVILLAVALLVMLPGKEARRGTDEAAPVSSEQGGPGVVSGGRRTRSLSPGGETANQGNPGQAPGGEQGGAGADDPAEGDEAGGFGGEEPSPGEAAAMSGAETPGAVPAQPAPHERVGVLPPGVKPKDKAEHLRMLNAQAVSLRLELKATRKFLEEGKQSGALPPEEAVTVVDQLKQTEERLKQTEEEAATLKAEGEK